MIAAFKSELYKLLTIRSTYIISLIGVAILGLFVFYGMGIKASPEALQHPTYLMENILSSVQNLSIFATLIAILMMTHEYRYNTITYTLTTSNSRTKVLLAKMGVLSLFALVFAAVVAVLGGLFVLLGVHLGGHELVSQTVYYQEIVWRSLAHVWGYVMLGLMLATLIRSQVGTIVALFILPTIEQLLSVWLLKDSSSLLPFNTLNTIISGHSGTPDVSTVEAAKLFLLYLVGGWLVTWVLFKKRDAN